MCAKFYIHFTFQKQKRKREREIFILKIRVREIVQTGKYWLYKHEDLT